VGKALGISAQSVSGWRAAKSGIAPDKARKLAVLLGVDAKTLVKPVRREPGRPTKVTLGPAQRALVLHEAAMAHPAHPVQAAPAQVQPKPTPVLGTEMLSDGTASVWLKVTLPADRAAALFRLLLDFNLTQEGDRNS
jgi:hypothetical protein